ncbi:MAG TPA: hypothetical protein VE692_00185, partial [Nitrososphaera sp.]|nr:hypothetical protein [Nitrososphaera sp.]
EPIEICHENLPLPPSDVGAQQEEENAPLAHELIILAQRELDRVSAVPSIGEEAAAQPYLQGRERQLTRCRLTRSIYTPRLTKMPSNNIIALQRDKEVSVKVKNRLLIRSRGLL